MKKYTQKQKEIKKNMWEKCNRINKKTSFFDNCNSTANNNNITRSVTKNNNNNSNNIIKVNECKNNNYSKKRIIDKMYIDKQNNLENTGIPNLKNKKRNQ